MRIVDDAVKDGICSRGVNDSVMPVLDWELARYDERAAVVALFEYFEEVSSLSVSERGTTEDID